MQMYYTVTQHFMLRTMFAIDVLILAKAILASRDASSWVGYMFFVATLFALV